MTFAEMINTYGGGGGGYEKKTDFNNKKNTNLRKIL